MMLKNEADLILPWVKYHGSIFGYTNLFIYDNGSDDKQTLSTLSFAKNLGANCIFDKCSPEDFKNKGDIFAALIKELDKNNPYDFYFPLDCDEFLSAKLNGNYVYTLEEISEALSIYERSPDQLKIGGCPTSNPVKPSFYRNVANQRKFFFAQGSCQKLDHGFHHGITKTGVTLQTNIVYFHFHYRNTLDTMQYHAKKKLDNNSTLDNYEHDTLKSYKGSGHHLTQYLIQSEKEYFQQFAQWDCEYIPSFEEKLKSLDLQLPYSTPLKQS